VVDRDSSPVAIEDGIDPKWQAHDQLKELTSIDAIGRDRVHNGGQLVADLRPAFVLDRRDQISG